MVLDSEARNGNKGVSSLTRGRALAWKAGSRKGHFLPEKASGEQSKAEGNWDACLILGKRKGLPGRSRGSACTAQMQPVYSLSTAWCAVLMRLPKFSPRFLALSTLWCCPG